MGHDAVIVIGAGISGLVAARTLTAAGKKVFVVEKSRGVGGRMATRRLRHGICDHGAQFITVRDAAFAELVDLGPSSTLKPWSRGFPTGGKATAADGHVRYRGAPAMTALAKQLAEGLNITQEWEVAGVQRDGGGWAVRNGEGAERLAAAVFVAAPIPQALALFSEGVLAPAQRTALSGSVYEPCFAALLCLDGPSAVPSPGGIYPFDGDPAARVAWIGDNLQKGVSPTTTLTVHATGAFSRACFDEAPALVLEQLVAAARPWIGAAEVVEQALHRWRFSQPLLPLADDFLRAEGVPPLFFVGDAFRRASVEGAALSGLRAAQCFLASG